MGQMGFSEEKVISTAFSKDSKASQLTEGKKKLDLVELSSRNIYFYDY